MDGETFSPTNGTDAARILCELADELRGGELQPDWDDEIVDRKGNVVGEARVTGMDIPNKQAMPDLDALYSTKDPVFQTANEPTRLPNMATTKHLDRSIKQVLTLQKSQIVTLLESLAHRLDVYDSTWLAKIIRAEKENWK